MDDRVRRAVDQEPDRLLDNLRSFIEGVEERPILPSQYYGDAPFDGEKKIRVRMLREAVREYKKNAHSISERGMAAFADVNLWVIANDYEWPYSFVNLCEALSIDVESARGALMRWRESSRGKRKKNPRPKPDSGGGTLPHQGGSDEGPPSA